MKTLLITLLLFVSYSDYVYIVDGPVLTVDDLNRINLESIPIHQVNTDLKKPN